MQFKYWIWFVLIGSATSVTGHPTGNMISFGEYVLWPYIDPIDDPGHHACVMKWSIGSEPEIIHRSDYEASDFILYSNGSVIYILERVFSQTKQRHQFRILQMGADFNAIVIWDWRDDIRPGEGGFYMITDDEMVYVEYPDVFYLHKDEPPVLCFEFNEKVKSLKKVDSDLLLLLGEEHCWLTDESGNMLQEWKSIKERNVVDAPLHLNMIFDVDYERGNILIANWGNRTFDLIDNKKMKSSIQHLKSPLAPHWVLFHQGKLMLFASRLLDGGSPPLPSLWMYDSNELIPIWIK